MNIQTEKIKRILTGRNFHRSFFRFMSRQAKLLMTLVVFFLFFYCIYLWYDYIYAPEWSEGKKQEYIKNKDKEIVFDKSNFEALVLESQKRQEESQKNIDVQSDIFQLKK